MLTATPQTSVKLLAAALHLSFLSEHGAVLVHLQLRTAHHIQHQFLHTLTVDVDTPHCLSVCPCCTIHLQSDGSESICCTSGENSPARNLIRQCRIRVHQTSLAALVVGRRRLTWMDPVDPQRATIRWAYDLATCKSTFVASTCWYCERAWYQISHTTEDRNREEYKETKRRDGDVHIFLLQQRRGVIDKYTRSATTTS